MGYKGPFLQTDLPAAPRPSWGQYAGPIASVAGSLIDAWSQSQSNKANARNVDKQLAFQDYQSRTQYQRATADMAAAGLNPALAYQQGGNSSQGGAAAKAEPISSNTGQKLASAVDAYTAFANGSAQRDLLRAQENATAAMADKTRRESQLMSPEMGPAGEREYLDAYKRAKYAEVGARQFTADKTPERFAADIANTGAGTANLQATTAEAKTRTTLNEQMFQNAWFRKNISPYINSTAKTVGLFSDVKDLINPMHFGKRPEYEPPLKNYDELQTFTKGSKHTSRTYRP